MRFQNHPFVVLTLLAILCPVSSHAKEPVERSFTPYIGLKGGMMFVDDSNVKPHAVRVDNAPAIGFTAGVELYGRFALEFSSLGGTADLSGLGVRGDAEIDTTAGYFVLRSGGQVYVLGRLGYIREEVEISIRNGTTTFATKDSDSGLSLGFGGGVRITNHFGLEAAYTQ